ncbi:MAG TPA: RNA polymerase sigma factor [Flavisolibacter sp.]|nr:RNA polymerase sigma factor [Flavisolibacter sp.]
MNNESDTNGALSDNEIIGRIVKGEKDLYALLVRRYNQRLYRVGMSILKDDTAVEDAMQVAYINAYENLSGFGFKSSFGTWLTRILINECLLHLKKKKRRLVMNAEILTSIKYQQLTADTQTPMKNVLNSELKTLLEEAIFALPEKYRTVFIMREMENMNVAETQACLHISEVNVKVRLNRAKALLRNSLGSYYKKEELLHFHLTRCDRMVERVMKHIEQL